MTKVLPWISSATNVTLSVLRYLRCEMSTGLMRMTFFFSSSSRASVAQRIKGLNCNAVRPVPRVKPAELLLRGKRPLS